MIRRKLDSNGNVSEELEGTPEEFGQYFKSLKRQMGSKSSSVKTVVKRSQRRVMRQAWSAKEELNLRALNKRGLKYGTMAARLHKGGFTERKRTAKAVAERLRIISKR